MQFSFKEKFLLIIEKFKSGFIETTRGTNNFNKMLYLWGLLPALIITIFFQRKIFLMQSNIITLILYIILASYFLWHLFCIRKSLKRQPQYRVIKEKKKDLYKDKTSEEIQKIKKEHSKDTLKKLLLLKSWNTSPNYIIIACIDAYVALTQIQNILRIVNIL